MDFFNLTNNQKALFKNKIKYFISQQISRHVDYFISVIINEQKAQNKEIVVNEEYIKNLTTALHDEFHDIMLKAVKEMKFDSKQILEVTYKTIVTKNDDTQLMRKIRTLLKQ